MAPIRHVQHVVQRRREQPAVAVREALHQGGALRGRAHRLPVRQSGGQRRARALRLDHEVRHREHERQRCMDGQRRHHQPVRLLQGERRSTEHGGSDVVGVALELGRELGQAGGIE